MSPSVEEPESTAPAEEEGRVLSVHLGPSANCSSIGSFVDFLFLSSIAGGAMVAVLAALADSRRDEPGDGDEEE